MLRILSFICIFCSLMALWIMPGWACRYNIRDVGFVDLESDPYQLYIYVDQSIADEVSTSIEQIAFASLLDSNVKAQVINTDKEPNHQAVEYIPSDHNHIPPFAVLVSPGGESKYIALIDEEGFSKEALWDHLDAIVRSPLRSAILKQLIDTYGVALFVKGKDEKATKQARQAIESALQETKQGMPALPKHVENPPVLFSVTPEQREQEALLLWSLEVDPNNVESPSVAIFYGRGRLMGRVLTGDEISQAEVSNYLSVIGLSCECGLDRSWMQGQMIPLQWSESLQKLAYQKLGFDLENPMVKMEISQILAKGGTGQNNQSSSNTTDSILMGYSENVVIEPMETTKQTEDREKKQPEIKSTAEISEPTSTPALTTTKEDNPKDKPFTWEFSYFFLITLGILILVTGALILSMDRGKKI